jgi:hypothetical protein
MREELIGTTGLDWAVGSCNLNLLSCNSLSQAVEISERDPISQSQKNVIRDLSSADTRI